MAQIRVGYNLDGQIVTLIDDIIADSGAYNPFNVTLSFNAASHLRNQFDIDNLRVHARHVLTNKQPTTPVRGAGRTEATFVMDRIVDLIAADLEMDPADIRLRNLIPARRCRETWECITGMAAAHLRQRGLPAQLRSALEKIGYEASGSGSKRPAGQAATSVSASPAMSRDPVMARSRAQSYA